MTKKLKPDDENPQPETEISAYGIHWQDTESHCAICDRTIGLGPVGLTNDQPPAPMCSPCLVRCHPGLGLHLMLADVARDVAGPEASGKAVSTKMLAMLIHIGKLRDLFTWPGRPLCVDQFLEDHADRFDNVDADTFLESL